MIYKKRRGSITNNKHIQSRLSLISQRILVPRLIRSRHNHPLQLLRLLLRDPPKLNHLRQQHMQPPLIPRVVPYAMLKHMCELRMRQRRNPRHIVRRPPRLLDRVIPQRLALVETRVSAGPVVDVVPRAYAVNCPVVARRQGHDPVVGLDVAVLCDDDADVELVPVWVGDCRVGFDEVWVVGVCVA
ncbi:uncharacterized protein BJX67DRAFT_362245 [Aspergillus lucknowensis]|uniref:Uncharacterized protein n=1 Tax=Aspergillus lucknowensis TaxID=176173 RepID=A0ABR4LHK7_9EURO